MVYIYEHILKLHIQSKYKLYESHKNGCTFLQSLCITLSKTTNLVKTGAFIQEGQVSLNYLTIF